MSKTPRLVLSLAIVAFVAGCGGGVEHQVSDTRPALAVRVLRVAAESGQLLVLPARVSAREEITITARMPGRLTSLPLREGDHFAAGQTLASFDAPETRAALEGAEAALAAASLQRDIARRQEARIDSLYAIGVAALHEREGAQSERRAAEAGWAQARAQADQMRTGTTIEAPFDGVVVRRHVDVGITAGPGQPLLDVRSLAAGEIIASVPESELERLAGGRAEYQLGDGPWRAALLTRVDGMTDFTTRSRTARFHPAGRDAPEPGAFARVRLAAATDRHAPAPVDAVQPGLSVPATALVRRGGLTGVYVVEDGVARLRWLRVGREGGGAVEVLAGLAPTDSVISDPAGLEDGRAVRVGP